MKNVIITFIMASLFLFGSVQPAGATAEGKGIAEGLNYAIDDFHNKTVYFGKFDSSSAGLYAAVFVDNTTNKATIVLRANCDGNTGTWQFFDKIFVKTDNQSYVINCDQDDCQYTVNSILLCQTYQRIADENDIVMLRDIAASKNATEYRFSGKYEKTRKIDGARRERLATMLQLYDYYNKLFSNSSKN